MLDEEPSFKHEVHGHHPWAPAQHVLERVGGKLQECRLLVFLPGRSRHHHLRLCPILSKDIGNLAAQFLHVGVDETTSMGGNEDTILFRLNTPDVVGGLNGVFHRLTHLDDSLRNLLQTGHQGVDGFRIDDGLLRWKFVNGTANIGVCIAV